MEKTYEIPIWRKYTLSVEEAAMYFRIGENKLRSLINEDKNADYLLWNGNRVQIKRAKFEQYIDKLETIQKQDFDKKRVIHGILTICYVMALQKGASIE